jgi:ubiquitin-conjugating enzyme E2 variant
VDPITYSRSHRRLEIGAIGTQLALSGWIAARIWRQTAGWRSTVMVAVGVLVGLLLADFISGFVHWMADTYGTTDTPVFGENFVRSFREHHADQLAITRHDFIQTNGDCCIFSVPLMTFILLVVPGGVGRLGPLFWLSSMLALGMATFLTSQIHKCSHQPEPQRWVRVLQRMRLILSPDHHARHHTPPFVTHYCITFGWLNPLLERVRFFRVAEWVVRHTLGLTARAHELPAAAAAPPVEAALDLDRKAA